VEAAFGDVLNMQHQEVLDHLTAGTWFSLALIFAVVLASAVKPALHASTAVMLMLMQFWRTQSATLIYEKSAFEVPALGGSSAE